MTATETILNYAAMQGGSFLRKDLLAHVAGLQPNIKRRAVDLQLSRLVASCTIIRKERGMYALTVNSLPEFTYQPSKEEREVFQKLKEQFPFLEMCIWSPRILSSFMLHVPDIGYSFVDVEKDGMESVFHALQSMNTGKNILIAPSAADCDRYLTGTDSIVVRQLIGQSPLTEVDGCTVPRIEKILVDAIGDNGLSFAGGSEIYNIYEYARERNNINMNKLLRYASRRNRKDKVEQILKAIDNDKLKE
jgi:hypothetical protein